MIVHVFMLYGAVTAAVFATVVTFRRSGDPPLPPWEVTKTLAPFAALALLESLSLCAAGHLIAEWLLPLLAALFATWCSRSQVVRAWTRRGLAIVAIVLWCHGSYLLSQGYVTRPYGLAPGRHSESDWFTPLTGLRRVDLRLN
jgi:hypothetical protein